MKGTKRYMEIALMDFPKKNLVPGKWAIFDLTMMRPRNYGSALRIFIIILRTERG